MCFTDKISCFFHFLNQLCQIVLHRRLWEFKSGRRVCWFGLCFAMKLSKHQRILWATTTGSPRNACSDRCGDQPCSLCQLGTQSCEPIPFNLKSNHLQIRSKRLRRRYKTDDTKIRSIEKHETSHGVRCWRFWSSCSPVGWKQTAIRRVQ